MRFPIKEGPPIIGPFRMSSPKPPSPVHAAQLSVVEACSTTAQHNGALDHQVRIGPAEFGNGDRMPALRRMRLANVRHAEPSSM